MCVNKTKKVIAVGGGIAGLSAGIYALRAGYEVEIYEKNPIPGGECTGWNRKGYHIDNCIHWLTGTLKGTELYKVWNDVGALNADTEYAKINSFYTSTYKGQRATLWNDLARTQEELITISPEDETEIRKFIQSVERSKQCLFPADKPMEMWGMKDYIKMGFSMADFSKVMREFGKSSIEEYAKRFKSPIIQKLMGDYLPKSYCAYSLPVSYATVVMGSGRIPMGGSLQMSHRMEKTFKALGGKIFYNKSVSRIILEKKKARGIELEDGTVVAGDYIIPAVDTQVLFGKMLPKSYMPKELKAAYDNYRDYPATSGFHVVFAVSESFNEGETIFIDINTLEIGASKFDRLSVRSYGYDNIFVRDGKQVIQIGILQTDADYDFWKSLTKEEYDALKKRLVKDVEARITEAFPQLKGGMEYLDAWTPLTYERYCNAYHGSYMSFITTPLGKRISMKGKLKGIENLYLAGQWTSSLPEDFPLQLQAGSLPYRGFLSLKKGY